MYYVSTYCKDFDEPVLRICFASLGNALIAAKDNHDWSPDDRVVVQDSDDEILAEHLPNK